MKEEPLAVTLTALWEAQEKVTVEAYVRQPDSPDAAFDPAAWELPELAGDLPLQLP
jgi:hypothetical protein